MFDILLVPILLYVFVLFLTMLHADPEIKNTPRKHFNRCLCLHVLHWIMLLISVELPIKSLFFGNLTEQVIHLCIILGITFLDVG